MSFKKYPLVLTFLFISFVMIAHLPSEVLALDSTVYLAPGSASLPSLTFTADTHTGLFQPAVNALSFTTGGIPRLTITESGRIGIGTTNPGQPLEIVNSAGSFVQLYAQYGTNEGGEIHLGGTTAGQGYYLEMFNNTLRGINSTRSVETFSFDQNGNLKAIGNGTFGASSTSPGTIQANIAPLSPGGIAIQAGNSKFLRFLANAGNASYNDITKAGDSVITFANGSQASGGLVLAPWAPGSSGLRIDSSGNVAVNGNLTIGNINPTAPLTILPNANNVSISAGGKSFFGVTGQAANSFNSSIIEICAGCGNPGGTAALWLLGNPDGTAILKLHNYGTADLMYISEKDNTFMFHYDSQPPYGVYQFKTAPNGGGVPTVVRMAIDGPFDAGQDRDRGVGFFDHVYVVANNGQISNLQDWRDINNNILASISPSGEFKGGSISANKLTISNTPLNSSSGQITPTIGTATIPAGSSNITLSSPAITANSKVFITPNKAVLIAVSNKDPQAKTFTVQLDTAQSTDITFDWWIVDSK